MERTCEAPSNEAPHMILGYHLTPDDVPADSNDVNNIVADIFTLHATKLLT